MTSALLLGLGIALGTVGCKKKAPEAAGAATSGAEAPAENPLVPPSQVAGETTEAAVARLVGVLRTGDVLAARQAVEELKALTARAPDVAEIPFNIGVAYELLGDETNARKAYLRATDIDPKLGAAWLNLGAMSEAKGELDRALQTYEAGLRFDPENGKLVVGVISVLRKQGRYPQAIEMAKKALGQDSKNIDIYNNLGLIYLAQGEHDLASFVYQKALNSIDGASGNAYLHANLGKVYQAKGQAYWARQEFGEALKLDPNLIPAMVDLAAMYMDDRNWTDAVSLLEKARDLSPSDAGLYLNLGICYRGQGRFEEAMAAYQKALELDGRNPDPYLNIAVLQGDSLRSYDAALASIDRYVAAGGRNTALAAQWRTELQEAKVKYEKELERKRKREEREAKRKEEDRLAAEFDRIKAERTAAANAARGQACPASGCPESLACNRDNVCVDEGSPGTAAAGAACKANTDCAYGLACGPQATCVPGASLDAPPPSLNPGVPPSPPPATPSEPSPAPNPW